MINNVIMVAGSGATVSNGGLTAVISTTIGSAKSNIGRNGFGKYYWEVKLSAGTNVVALGVHNAATFTGTESGNWRGFSMYNGTKQPGGAAYTSSATVGTIVSVLLDLDNGTIEFWRNGVSMGICHTDVKKLGDVFPAVCYGASSDSATLNFNFGNSPFSYALPLGYTPYNTAIIERFLLQKGNLVFSLQTKDISPIEILMTSNTTPVTSGVASSSSDYNSTYAAWKAFNGTSANSTDTWVTAAGITTGWLQYKFNLPRKVGRYGLTTRNDATRGDPKDWTFEGSNDGFSWEILDSRVEVIGWGISETRYFDIKNPKPFTHYRIKITALNGTPAYISIGEMSFYEPSVSELFILNGTPDESDFISRGSRDAIKFENIIEKFIKIEKKFNQLDSGRLFEHELDLGKRRVKKITLN